MTAQVLKTIQEATTAQAKQVSLDGQIGQKHEMIKVSEYGAFCSKRKEKEENQAQKKKEREEKRTKNQVNFQLAQIEFLVGRISPVE